MRGWCRRHGWWAVGLGLSIVVVLPFWRRPYLALLMVPEWLIVAYVVGRLYEGARSRRPSSGSPRRGLEELRRAGDHKDPKGSTTLGRGAFPAS